MNEIDLVELLWSIVGRIMKRLRPLAREAGLSMTEALVLWKAHRSGAQRVTVLAKELGLPPSTLTGILDRLVAGGWLVRDRDSQDRRAVVMKETDKLTDLIRSLKRTSSRSLATMFRSLPVEAAERLKADLAALLGSMDREERL